MSRKKLIAVAILVILFAAAPFIVRSEYIVHLLILCFIYAVIASNWGLTVGYSGVFNFAHFSFFAIGAYTGAILSVSYGVSPWIGMLAAAGTAALSAFIIGLPSLRLKGIYFALFTFAFQQALYSIIFINPGGLTNGPQGLVRIPALRIGSMRLDHFNKGPAYYVALVIFLLSTVYLYAIVNSRVGLAFKALRDSEDYAVSRGISPYRYKLVSVIASAVFTGIMGSFYAYYMAVLGPAILGWGILILGLAMMVIGGLGTLVGPIVAAFVLTFASEYLTGIGGYRFVIIAAIMLGGLLIGPLAARGGVMWVRTAVCRIFAKGVGTRSEAGRGE